MLQRTTKAQTSKSLYLGSCLPASAAVHTAWSRLASDALPVCCSRMQCVKGGCLHGPAESHSTGILSKVAQGFFVVGTTQYRTALQYPV